MAEIFFPRSCVGLNIHGLRGFKHMAGKLVFAFLFFGLYFLTRKESSYCVALGMRHVISKRNI